MYNIFDINDIIYEIIKWLDIENLLKLRKVNKLLNYIVSDQINIYEFLKIHNSTNIADETISLKKIEYILFKYANYHIKNRNLEFHCYLLKKYINKYHMYIWPNTKNYSNYKRYCDKASQSHPDLLKIFLDNEIIYNTGLIYEITEESIKYIISNRMLKNIELIYDHIKKNEPSKNTLSWLIWHTTINEFRHNIEFLL